MFISYALLFNWLIIKFLKMLQVNYRNSKILTNSVIYRNLAKICWLAICKMVENTITSHNRVG